MAKKPKKQLADYTEEELDKSMGAMRGLFIVILLLIVSYAGYYIYLFASGNFDSDRHVLGIVPFLCLFPACLPAWMAYGRLKAEKDRRG
ncbi:MAG: hypothetical protein AAFR61_13540 [Bacteroidota bacterium]